MVIHRRSPIKREKHEAQREEQSLLRDNNILPAKYPRKEAPASIHGKDKRRVSLDTSQQEALDNNVSENTRLQANQNFPTEARTRLKT